MSEWRWTVLSDGWTETHAGVLLPGAGWRRKIRLYATAILLEHPHHGAILFDTGYSSRFLDITGRWPYLLYRMVTPVVLSKPGGIASELARRGISPSQVRHVIISHWHADHIGGLKDFPYATVHSTRAAWDSIQRLRGIAAVRRAFLPGLVPDDMRIRLQWADEENGDVLGDGSLRTVALPGHARGQIGLRFTAHDGREILLAADGCWLSESYRRNVAPHWITGIINKPQEYRSTLEKLHRMHQENPDMLILPSHCPETAAHIKP